MIPFYLINMGVLYAIRKRRASMIKSYTHPDLIQVNMIKNYLSSKDIQLEIRNHLLPQIAGEIPAGDCWPSLWSKNEDDHEKIIELMYKIRRIYNIHMILLSYEKLNMGLNTDNGLLVKGNNFSIFII